jgi:hypothetical protein
MSVATYKDLCIDVTDPAVAGRFWAGALGLRIQTGDDGRVHHLTGATPQHTLWLNQVTEQRTVKQRVHLDVRAGSVQELVDLGGTVIDAESFDWTVMADAEGGELCAFVSDEPIEQRFYGLVLDCADHQKVATWWSEVLGGRAALEEGYSVVEQIPGAPFEAMVFVPVPEPKQGKNRIHLDVTTDDLDGLLAAGASLLRAQGGDIAWHVLADPEGNEFCAFTE